jgi:hypothetical protein
LLDLFPLRKQTAVFGVQVVAFWGRGFLPSVRLAEGLGFCCEGGPLIDYWRVGTKFVSVVIYALINNKD